MQLLADQPGTARSLADIARHLGVSKSTCYPMVMALTESGWLLRDPVSKWYLLGPALVPIGAAAASSMVPVEIARPRLRSLADETGMAAIAFVPTGADLAVAEIVQPQGGRRPTLGLRVADTLEMAAPLGAALAAWYPPERRGEWLELGAKHLGRDYQELEDVFGPKLAEIRGRGYSVECANQSDAALSDTLAELRGAREVGQRAVSAIREAQRRLSGDVVVGPIDSAAEYEPISINSTAFGPNGVPAVILAVVDPRSTLLGRQVSELGDRVHRAAQEVTDTLGGAEPEWL